MCHDDQAVRPPAGCRRVVIPRDECRDRLCQLLGECRAVGGGLETNFRVDRQRGQFLARFPSASHQAADFADDARRQGNQIAGRQRARAATRIRRDWTKSDWRHDVRGAAGDHDTLGESAPKPLLGHLHQAMRFERSQVVVDFWRGIPRRVARVAAEAGSTNAARSWLFMGSTAIAAAAESSMTCTSSMPQSDH